MAAERERADVAERRRIWTEKRQPRMRLEPKRLVFIDETAVATNLVRLRGRSVRGERLPAQAPFGHWNTQTFIAGLRCDRLTAPWIVDGAMDRTAFNLYIETQLAPTLARGDVVILDNLSVHNSAHAAEALKARGAWFLFLPRNTRPISIQSRWRSQSSRRICAPPLLVPSRHSGPHLAISAPCSTPRNAGTSSKPQAMRPIKRTMLAFVPELRCV
jgi:hypothetical protein